MSSASGEFQNRRWRVTTRDPAKKILTEGQSTEDSLKDAKRSKRARLDGSLSISTEVQDEKGLFLVLRLEIEQSIEATKHSMEHNT